MLHLENHGMLEGYIFAEISRRFCHASTNLYQNNIPSSKHTSHKNMKFIKSRFFLPKPIQLNDSGASCWQNSVAPCACAHRQRPCPSFTRTASRWQHSPSERWAQGCQWSCRPGFLRWWFYAVEDFNVKMFEKCVKSTCSFTIVEIKLWCQQFD